MLFGYLTEPEFNFSAYLAIENIIYSAPSDCQPAVEAYVGWFIANRDKISKLTFQPHEIFARNVNVFPTHISEESRKLATLTIAHSLAYAHVNKNKEIRDLAQTLLKRIVPSVVGGPTLDTAASQEDREGQYEAWKKWWLAIKEKLILKENHLSLSRAVNRGIRRISNN